ncbi:3 beta-hydroxysteroid dehydrogenase/Delta 5 [Platysternon megacephalum]|uniref:3 beta-hydroxysteroid dehydrogenase/Delta 5 n=1 Tax=Platysternon megacephalum TaxID=55544 RepID=A0A4D9E9Y2_9SAUR|nr:3 beta-hydroxysteroid dehydrogenase/Delta 5 [Platysternon megacephalum]
MKNKQGICVDSTAKLSVISWNERIKMWFCSAHTFLSCLHCWGGSGGLCYVFLKIERVAGGLNSRITSNQVAGYTCFPCEIVRTSAILLTHPPSTTSELSFFGNRNLNPVNSHLKRLLSHCF